MKVSVLVITYNQENYIRQAIESILHQRTDFEYEIVVGEDKSTDGTRQILFDLHKEYPGRINLLCHEKNLGMVRNFIDTLNHCHGKYVAILEGDDYWTTASKLQKQVDLMEDNSAYSMCGGIAVIIGTAKSGYEQELSRFQPKVLRECYELSDIIEDYFIHTSTFIFRKELVEFSALLSVSDNLDVINLDEVILVTLAGKGPVGYLNEPLSAYRLHQGGIWTGKTIKDKHHRMRATLDVIKEYFQGRYAKELYYREYGHLKMSCLELLKNDQSWESKQLYFEAFKRLRGTLIVPLLVLGCNIYGYRYILAWQRLSIFLGIRTRIRRLLFGTQ